ncbi:MAG: hypothetical protein J6581_04145 [Apibacter sp.]|nr:hypothetical protein [Apibacter sp.]
MKRMVSIFVFVIHAVILFGQVGIGTENPDSSSILEIKSSNKGFLPPRVNIKSIIDTVTIKNPATGLIIYEPDGFTEMINNKAYTREAGVYMFNGHEWQRLYASNSIDSISPSDGKNLVGVKIRVNQSGYIPLSGFQSYGLLLQNNLVTVNPQYANGIWPPQSSSPSDILSPGNGDSGNLLLENKVSQQANFFRINFEYVILNRQPISNGIFYVSIVSNATQETIYSDAVIVPSGTNVGSNVKFQIAFPTLSDSESINQGYKIMFRADTALPVMAGNVGVKIIDIVRIN